MSESNQYSNRIDILYGYAEEMLSLFKGELSYTEIMEMSYKEGLKFREIRIKREETRRKQMEESMKGK